MHSKHNLSYPSLLHMHAKTCVCRALCPPPPQRTVLMIVSSGRVCETYSLGRLQCQIR